MAKVILTVDDSASVRQMVKFTLSDAGYSVLEAVDGNDALTKLSQPVNLVITDLNMPNLDGIGLIRQDTGESGAQGTAHHHAHHRIAGVAQAGRQSRGRHRLDGETVSDAADSSRGEEGDRMNDRHKQAFMEEARDLLTELEAALLELDQARDDVEVVGRAFRALHTIKGSGAMFGFDEIASFTHNLETAFERLRSGQITATDDLINLTLAAGDQIRAMLDDSRGTRERGRRRLSQADLGTARSDRNAATEGAGIDGLANRTG